MPHRPRGKFSALENFSSAQECRLHAPAKLAPRVRRHLVPVMQLRRLHAKFCVRIPDHKISVNPPRSLLFFPQVRQAAPAPRTTTAQDASQHSRAHVPPSTRPASSVARKQSRPKRAKNLLPPAASSPEDKASDRSPQNPASHHPIPATTFLGSRARESAARI